MKVGRYLLPSRRPAARWTIMKERNLLHVPIIGEESNPLGVINARGAAWLKLSRRVVALPQRCVGT